MKMRIRYRILALAAAALLSGCAKESAVMNLPEAEKVTVQIKTKALTGSVVEGVTIEKVRFMLFQNETLLNNYTTSNGTLNIDDSGLFNLAVSPGVYYFAAIINETPELTEKLNAVTKRTDIDGAGFDWQNSTLTSSNMPLANLGEIKIHDVRTRSGATAPRIQFGKQQIQRWLHGCIRNRKHRYAPRDVASIRVFATGRCGDGRNKNQQRAG